MIKSRYVIISPVRNEQEYIIKTIQSVVSQSILPVTWILVNDGSNDKTREIIEEYLNEFKWIKLINRPDRGYRAGKGPAEAFNEGLSHLDIDYDFIVNLDGDVSFDDDYFKKLFEKFESNPKLGIASGKSYSLSGGKQVLYRSTDTSTMGASKTYRKKCFKDIGGKLFPNAAWDMLDDLSAQMLGWETRSFSDIHFIHYKSIGFKQGNPVRLQVRSGAFLYSYGYHPIYIVAKGIYRMFDKPYILGGAALIMGYYSAMLRGDKIIVAPDVMKFMRDRQVKYLCDKFIFWVKK